MNIRARTDVDLDACVTLARMVHARDGYPPFLPDRDFTGFLVSADALAVWVATEGPDIVGHVALHHRSSAAVMELAARELGVTTDSLAVVARLLVAPDHRRQGVATRLLDTAVARARADDRTPILDVWTGLPGAVGTYERLGWRRLGIVAFAPPGLDPMPEVVFAAP